MNLSSISLPLPRDSSYPNYTMVPVPPANLGQRLLPSLIDKIARDDPSRVLYSVAKSKDIADGFQDIDARAFAQAVDRCAWHLEKTVGRGEGFSTLLYMGPQDVVYAIMVHITSHATWYCPDNLRTAHASTHMVHMALYRS